MRSEALDILIEGCGGTTWIILSGPFHKEQIANIREKILGLLNDANRGIIVDLEGLTEIDPEVIPMFLLLLNRVKEKGGFLKFVFKNEIVSTAFLNYRTLFDISPDNQSLKSGGILNKIRRRSALLRRKTGVRISRPVAVFLLFVLCGWFLTLGFVIRLQNRTIRTQEQEINELHTWKKSAEIEMKNLTERLRPLEQLGLIQDSLPE